MKLKKHLMRAIAVVLVLSSLMMCAKKSDKKETGSSTPDTIDQILGKPDETGIACTYTVKPSEWFVDGTTIPAGSTICIPAGTRGALLLKNFKGTAAKPIIIINKGGKVTFTEPATASYAFKTQNCQYFKIMGNGDATTEYGFVVNGGNIGMTMDDLSSDFEIAHVEVRNPAFAGIMAKTDPSCDVATQRGHFTMSNVSIHDNYVHKTGGEGFYIGNSFYADGVSVACGTVLPHDVTNLKVYNNRADSTGCEGIQVGAAISGAEIYNNTVTNPGLTPFASGQNNGIQIGEGSGGKCYNNLIKNAPGNGIIVLGLGDNLVYNNIILNAGGHGIFADSRYTPGPQFQFINNTIVSPGQNGIRLNSEVIHMNIVINNVIIIRSGGVAISRNNSSVKLTSLNNYINTDVTACKFVNYGTGDFHLQSSSPLINAGADATAYGVSADYYGTLRPAGGTFDIGATEQQ
ncbi:right-handed parallel beta-helix repeat-containing protein [Mucilaginibacter psychrotolerans]|uniref:Right-handed parallel beta-helix repeat-containing protein n=1 Tax=Mucilaginibacter psychrotolerans TaxID=1524096 RepID=A0A4Y8S2H1_9SPHI|nr:right-handed parallel beta-helix repeat-containing protein [Mucilaginibacter psychrotolerans]TFF33258.1 right-handed parallel beta-helix repeat-containing protein [Mucilaginibacter psychrotolerans]